MTTAFIQKESRVIPIFMSNFDIFQSVRMYDQLSSCYVIPCCGGRATVPCQNISLSNQLPPRTPRGCKVLFCSCGGSKTSQSEKSNPLLEIYKSTRSKKWWTNHYSKQVSEQVSQQIPSAQFSPIVAVTW